MLKIKKPEARVQGNNRRIGPAQSLDDLRRIDVAPRSRSLADLAGNVVGRSGRQEGRHRCNSFPMPSTNVTTCVDVCQPKIMTKAPGILRGSHRHVKATSGQRQAFFPSVLSGITLDWSLESSTSTKFPAPSPWKIRSKSLDELWLIRRKDWQSAQMSTRSRKKT